MKTGYERLQSPAPWLRLVCCLLPIIEIHLMMDIGVIEQNKPVLETESLDVMVSTETSILSGGCIAASLVLLVLWFCLRMKGVAYKKGYLELG